jgi:protein-disulfide isomerase
VIFEPDWQDALPHSIRVGDSLAAITIVVFSDLECPACASFHQPARAILRKHKKDVSLAFVHFPLAMHRFAIQAAQAAECASTAGHFEAFIDVVYAKQDSLGLKTWGSYAHEAGIRDTAAITACARQAVPVERVEAGRELGLRWALTGTPTVIINGRRYASAPSSHEIERVARELLEVRRASR